MTTVVRKRFRQINDLLSKEQLHIVNTALILMVPTVLTKVTGQVFNLLAASYFGTGDPGWNQFIIASAIPELLTNVLLIGALGSIVIPILLSAKKEAGQETFLRVYSSIINFSLLIFIIISIVLIISANDIIPAILKTVIYDKNDYPSPEEYNNIANMMRVLLLPQIILGISVFISSGINVYNRLLVPTLAPLFYNIGRILAIIILVPLMNFSPWAIVIGTIFASALHLVIQIPLFLKLDLRYLPVIDWQSKYLKEIMILGGPRIFALSSEHMAFAFNKFLAYGQNGAAALFYANSLSLVIPTLFGYTFSYASYPTIAHLYVEGEFEKIRSITIKTLNEILFLSLPFTVAFMVLRVPIVRLSFGLLPGTNFTLDDTYQVSWILLWFSLGWVFFSGRWFLYRLYYASKDTMIPLIVSIVSLVLIFFLSLIFSNLFSHNEMLAISDIRFSFENLVTRVNSDKNIAGVGGISLAMSVVYSLEFFILLVVFDRKKMNIGLRSLAKKSLRKFYAGFVMLVVLYFLYKTWNVISYTLPDRAGIEYRGSTTINLFLLMMITMIPSFLVYYLMCLLLKVEELKILKRYLNPIFRLGGLRIE